MIDNDLLADSIKSASKVYFLSFSKELSLYSRALYDVTMWGKGIDEINKMVYEKDKCLK